MWRRPVGFAGSGPSNRGSKKIQSSDMDPQAAPSTRAIDGRQLSDEFIEGMEESKKNAPPAPNFVEQMRERKRNGTS